MWTTYKFLGTGPDRPLTAYHRLTTRPRDADPVRDVTTPQADHHSIRGECHMRRRFHHSVLLLCVQATAITLVLGGCPPFTSFPGGNEEPPAKLLPFQSEKELLDYFQTQAVRRTTWRHGGGWFLSGAAEDLAAGDDASPTNETGDYSTTNLQEEGVDEGDVFKSDGQYFYIARQRELRIVQATPADELAEVGRLDLDIEVRDLYLFGSTVIVLGSDWPWSTLATELSWPPYRSASTLSVYQIDVSDPTNPTVIGELTLDGVLVSSRLTNGHLILVLTIQPELPGGPSSAAIARMTLDEVLPKARLGGGPAEVAVPWQRWLRPAAADGYCITSVVSLDAANVETIVDSVAVLANAGTIYASTAALYITDTAYTTSAAPRLHTAIHKFSFEEDGTTPYVASGNVPGRPINQFALSERAGYLRVATEVTSSAWAWAGGAELFGGDVAVSSDQAADDANDAEAAEPPYSAVYVLQAADSDLQVVGHVAGIAPNESMYAARFVDDRAFLVTFERIDPLFIVDLTDPTQPQVLGELKIPGYSEYLHPLGDSHLIGVGYAVETFEPWGFTEPSSVQLSLFDVSDWSDPQLVEQITIGGAHSYADATWNHKAFTLHTHADQTLLALPVVLTPDATSWTEWVAPEFQGVICLEVVPAAGFTELGRLAALTNDEQQMEWGGWVDWRRAAFIGDTIYAISPNGVQAAPLTDFGATHAVELADAE